MPHLYHQNSGVNAFGANKGFGHKVTVNRSTPKQPNTIYNPK